MSGEVKNQSKENEKFIMQPIQTVDGQKRIKKYLKLKVVGSGSYSKCFLVQNVDSESTYVVKVIPKKKLQILQKQKLIYEIKIHQSLLHPNVVHLDHWFEDDNNQYIFMQYCPNGNLEMKLSEGNLDEKQIRKYSQQIVEALKYIHSQNILHREYSINHVVQSSLGDFGFACQLSSQYDRKRQTCGTPNYIAPEAISGFGYTFSSDVWAVGVILYRLKFGSCPFEGQSVKRTLQNVKICNYKFPAKPKISAELKDLIQKIFNLNYDDRLTTSDILGHKFYQHVHRQAIETPQKELKVEKRGFSLSRLFSREAKTEVKQKQNKQQTKTRQNLMERQSRHQPSVQKKQQPKRSNSCEAFKEIKQIFKNKSKQNLATTGNLSKRDQSPSPYYTINTIVAEGNENKQQTQSIKSGRISLIEDSYSMSFNLNQTHSEFLKNPKNNERSSRLNQFIKTQVNSMSLKDQLKQNKQSSSKIAEGQTLKLKSEEEQKIGNLNNLNVNNLNSANTNSSKPPLITSTQQQKKNHIPFSHPPQPHILKISKSSSSSAQSLLNSYFKRYYFPYQIQQQKDVTIIHYKVSLKHIVYGNMCLIMHKTVENLYKTSGESFDCRELPKILKYIIQNKIQIREEDQDEEVAGYLNRVEGLGEILQGLPQHVSVLKDGVILRYGHNNSLICGKIFAQQGYCLIQENGQPLLFTIDNKRVPQILEGVVVIRIYSGWIKTHIRRQ